MINISFLEIYTQNFTFFQLVNRKFPNIVYDKKVLFLLNL